MAPQQIELKVFVRNGKDKTKVLQAATQLEGVTKVSLDAEKGTVTVVGEVDPVLLTKQVRKVMKNATIVSVGGPPPAPNVSDQESNKSGNSPRMVVINDGYLPCYPGYGHYTLL